MPGESPDRDALARMGAQLRHRGPDDAGLEVLDNAGLVSTRLAIVDPSPAGHEPMADPSGRWWLSYNGEVFNHLELRRRLGGRAWRGGGGPGTGRDTPSQGGPQAPPRVKRLFAVAPP